MENAAMTLTRSHYTPKQKYESIKIIFDRRNCSLRQASQNNCLPKQVMLSIKIDKSM